MERYCYIKHGDAADELRQIHLRPDGVHEGPMTYVFQFVKAFAPHPILMFSFFDVEDAYETGRTRAFTHRYKARRTSVIKKAYFHIRIAWLTTRHLIRFRPSHILCANEMIPLWVSLAYAGLTGARLVHTRHNRIEHIGSVAGKLAALPAKKFIAWCDHVVCHGFYTRDQLIRIGVAPERITVFRPDYRRFYRSSLANLDQVKDYTEGGRYRLICFSGRLFIDKGVLDLLAAVEERLRRETDLRLVYIGDGYAMAPLLEAIQRKGLCDRVICLGNIPNDHVGAIVHQSLFAITPTRREFPEGFCKSAAESLVMGRPVIAPDFGPFPYFIEHGANGMLFEPNSVENLRRSIDALLDDPDLHRRLTDGAKSAGMKLIKAPKSFAEAVREGFGAGPEHPLTKGP